MTTNTPTRACASCSYFVHESGPYGQCHYQPPAPVWAKVGKADWCGQFSAAPAPAPVAAKPPLPPAPYVRGTTTPVGRKGGAA